MVDNRSQRLKTCRWTKQMQEGAQRYAACFEQPHNGVYAAGENSPLIDDPEELLGRINKEAVEHIPDVPENGRIELEADRTQHKGLTTVKMKRDMFLHNRITVNSAG